MITEIGGTVGDIESLPFLEAARQVRHDVGRDNCFFLHVSLVPYLAPSGELKTKPTQHSVAALRSIGITPDAIVCRSDREIPDNVKRKISLMCDVDAEAVVSAIDAPSIYEIPKVLHARGPGRLRRAPARPAVPRRRLDRVGRPARPGAPSAARGHGRAGRQVRRPARRLPVGVRGAARGGVRPPRQGQHPLGAVGLVRDAGRRGGRSWPASTASSSPAGSASAASRARSARSATRASSGIPTLGLCLGLQCMVIETARHLAGIEDANSAEFDPDTPDPVIATMADQVDIVAGNADLGGTMRLGAYPATLTPGSLVAEAYGSTSVSERHRHRYEVNNAYRDRLEAAGLVISGTSPDGRLVEFVELPRDVAPVLRRAPRRTRS